MLLSGVEAYHMHSVSLLRTLIPDLLVPVVLQLDEMHKVAENAWLRSSE